MEVRWVMVEEVHPDDDSQEPREFGHAGKRSAQAGAVRYRRIAVRIISMPTSHSSPERKKEKHVGLDLTGLFVPAPDGTRRLSLPERFLREVRAPEGSLDEPLPGDLFLLWNDARSTFVRTGVVVQVLRRRPPYGTATVDECEVIEADTNAERMLGGGRVLRHLRQFVARDRFVRWCEPGSASPGHVLDDEQ